MARIALSPHPQDATFGRRSKPSRAVSLPSPELQRMGFDFDEFDAEIVAALEGEAAAVDPFAASVERMLEGGVAPASSYEAAGAYNIVEGDYADSSSAGADHEFRSAIRAEIDAVMTDAATRVGVGERLVEFDPRVMEYLANPSVAQEVISEVATRVHLGIDWLPDVLRQELEASVARELDGFLARGGYADRFHPVREYLESIGAPLQTDVTGEPIRVVGLDPAADPALLHEPFGALDRDHIRGLSDSDLDWALRNARHNLMGAMAGQTYEEWQTTPAMERLLALEAEVTTRDAEHEALTEGDDRAMSGLSDAERAAMNRPGGFTPPDISGLTRPGGFIPPDMPNVGPGGFTPVRPDMGATVLPGAPIRGPQAPTILSSGLTADEAFQQHQATSGVGAMTGAGAMAGMNAMAGGGQKVLDLGDAGGRRLTPAQIAAGQAGVRTAKGILGGTIPAPPEPDVVTPPVPPEQETLFMEGLNPEARSMDSQMLADLMAQQATQPEQGYFGGMGEAVQGLTDRVAGMSGQERAALIAALVAAGLLTAGSGGMLAPAGAALMGGAGMAALSQ